MTHNSILSILLFLSFFGLFAQEKDEGKAYDWAPGAHTNIPGINAAERTISVYLPKQYDGKIGLPILWILSPNGKPRFEYTEWSEKRGVIMICINTSRNGPSDNNIAAHKEAILTINGLKLVYNGNMLMGKGMSGGAQSAWLMAGGLKKHFVGLLMCGQAGWQQVPLSTDVSVAYIQGKTEPNKPFMEATAKFLRTKGNKVEYHVVPGGHVQGPKDLHEKMLDWMLSNAAKKKSEQALNDKNYADAGYYYKMAAGLGVEGAEETLKSLKEPVDKYTSIAMGYFEKEDYYNAYKAFKKIHDKYGDFAELATTKLDELEKGELNKEVKAGAYLDRCIRFQKVRDINNFKRNLSLLMKNYPESKAAAEARTRWAKKK